MEITLANFQLKAIFDLMEAMEGLHNEIVLKSCTGSGKTIILTHFIDEYIKSNSRTVFIWLTPGKGGLEEQSKKYIVIKNSGTQQKIYLKDIYYIESSNKKVIYHTKNGRFDTYGKMEELEKELGNAFYRCHRCYLVSMEKICAYSADTIQVVGGDELILAQKKYTDFVKRYMRYAKDGGIVNV